MTRKKNMIVLKTKTDIEAMRPACQAAAEVLYAVAELVEPGRTTQELDDLSIATAVMLMADEPNYSKVAARMLSENIRKDIIFSDFAENSSCETPIILPAASFVRIISPF